MNFLSTCILALLLFFAASPLTAVNPVPLISGVSPVSTAPGGGDFTLTVRGAGFINGQSVIDWNGSALPDPTSCTPASPPNQATCTVTVRAAKIAAAQTANITVVRLYGEPRARGQCVGNAKVP